MAQITRAFQDDNCSICNDYKAVRVIVDKGKYVCICESCAESIKDKTINEIIKEYGKPLKKKSRKK